MSYFPMFVELKNRHCLIVGGGQIALHKIKVLLDFGAQIVVIAQEILPEIYEIGNIECKQKGFEEKDLYGQEFVVAATDDTGLNHRISMACKKKKIPINVVDQPSECSFIFPAYLKQGEVVAAFSSGGQSPVITQYLKEQMRPVMTSLIGEIAGCLGNLRESVQQCPETRDAAKEIYRELLLYSLEKDSIPSEEEIERIIRKYSFIQKGNQNGKDKKIKAKCHFKGHGSGKPGTCIGTDLSDICSRRPGYLPSD